MTQEKCILGFKVCYNCDSSGCKSSRLTNTVTSEQDNNVTIIVIKLPRCVVVHYTTSRNWLAEIVHYTTLENSGRGLSEPYSLGQETGTCVPTNEFCKN